MTQTILLSFLAGVLAANATPHFVKGITGERFPTLFGAGPLVNLVAGWAMYVMAASLMFATQLDRHPIAALAAGSAGALAMGVFHARGGAFALGRRPASGSVPD